MPFIKPENMEPQEESPADTMMNKSSAATAIHTPAGCRPTKAIARLVSSAVFFAAFLVFSAAFFAVAAPPFFAAFAYCRLICCFCMKRERGLPAICGLSCRDLWYWKSTFALNAAFSAFAAAR